MKLLAGGALLVAMVAAAPPPGPEPATLTVPERHGRSAGRALELLYLRFPATREEPGPPIVLLGDGFLLPYLDRAIIQPPHQGLTIGTEADRVDVTGIPVQHGQFAAGA